MALHFYMGGTTGNQDGTEISNGDLTNPLIFDGAYPAAGTTLEKSITIHIRADAGETWKGVILALISTAKQNNASRANIQAEFFIAIRGVSNSGSYATQKLQYLPSVSDTNIAITVTAYFSGSATNTPDTSVKIAAVQGCKIESGLVTQVLAGAYTAGTNSDNLMVLFGGTPGGTDGTEITNITSFGNIAAGMTGVDGYSGIGGAIPLLLRARSGYRMTDVKIKSGYQTNSKGFSLARGAFSSWPNENIYSVDTEELPVGTVTDSANVLIYLTACFDYSSSDTSITLQNAFVKSYVETYVGA